MTRVSSSYAGSLLVLDWSPRPRCLMPRRAIRSKRESAVRKSAARLHVFMATVNATADGRCGIWRSSLVAATPAATPDSLRQAAMAVWNEMQSGCQDTGPEGVSGRSRALICSSRFELRSAYGGASRSHGPKQPPCLLPRPRPFVHGQCGVVVDQVGCEPHSQRPEHASHRRQRCVERPARRQSDRELAVGLQRV